MGGYCLAECNDEVHRSATEWNGQINKKLAFWLFWKEILAECNGMERSATDLAVKNGPINNFFSLFVIVEGKAMPKIAPMGFAEGLRHGFASKNLARK